MSLKAPRGHGHDQYGTGRDFIPFQMAQLSGSAWMAYRSTPKSKGSPIGDGNALPGSGNLQGREAVIDVTGVQPSWLMSWHVDTCSYCVLLLLILHQQFLFGSIRLDPLIVQQGRRGWLKTQAVKPSITRSLGNKSSFTHCSCCLARNSLYRPEHGWQILCIQFKDAVERSGVKSSSSVVSDRAEQLK